MIEGGSNFKDSTQNELLLAQMFTLFLCVTGQRFSAGRPDEDID